MQEPSDHTVSRKEDGSWRREQFPRIPAHQPLSEFGYNKLRRECNEVCVSPVRANLGCDAISGQVQTITLHAKYPSEREARSSETEDAFNRSAANVAELLRRRLTDG